MKTNLVVTTVIAILTASASYAEIDCPSSVRVQVDGLRSTSSTNKRAINQLYERGDKQTSKSFIAASLASVNQIESLDDRLTLNNDTYRMECDYKGKQSRLLIKRGPKEGTYLAQLSIGRVDYENENRGSNPISMHGIGAGVLETYLTNVSRNGIGENANRANYLYMELDVQIPMEEGTDGFTETAKIGQAASVSYSVIR